MSKTKVAVIGLGYVGLPILAAISKSPKYDAIGYDTLEAKVKNINAGECPINDEVCEADMKEFGITATSKIEDIKDANIYVICVPTPVMSDYTPDYSYVLSAASSIAPFLEPGNTVILESTVNPGTCEEILQPKLEELTDLKVGKDITLAHCPERINPGDPRWTVYNIPRNVGAIPSEKASKVADFYRDILEAEVNPVNSIKVAEATKIVENTFRDVNIAFVNELAKSFDAMGIDVVETIKGAANKPFGYMPFWPGRGVGGHCIAVDPYYLIQRAAKSGFNHQFLKIARDINNSMPSYTVQRLQEALNEVKLPINGTKVALLGMSYKPNVGDLRESPCLEVATILQDKGAELTIFEPYDAKVSNVTTFDEAIKDAQAVIILTAHDEFKPRLEKILKSPTIKVVIDGMNKYDKTDFEGTDIVYKGIGKS